ncbi:outer membrane protein assembly factor BamB family protein [Priestia aryabhattai]
MFKKINLLMLALIVLISLLPAKAIKVAAAFNEGSAYQEGKYKETAQHPLGTSWSKNSQYESVNATKATEIFTATNRFTTNPLVDEDGTIYIGAVDQRTNKLYALDSGGNVKWSRDTSKPVKGMALYANGNLIYNDTKLNMIDVKNGKDVWNEPINIGANIQNGEGLFKGSPVIDKEGHIIIPHVNGIYVFNGNGSLLNYMPNSGNDNYKTNGVTIDNEGTIYHPNIFVKSFTLENNQLVKKYEDYSNSNSIQYDTITVLENGKIVFDVPRGPAKIINMKDQATIKLETGLGDMGVSKNTTVYNKDKSIYVPFESITSSYSGPFLLNKYNKEGELQWSQRMQYKIVSSPIIDLKGNVLVVEQVLGGPRYLTSISEDKKTNWSVKLPSTTTDTTDAIDPIPVITKDGSVIVAAHRSLFKVTGESNNPDDSNVVEPEPDPTPEPEEKPETKLITVFNETNKYDTSSFNNKSNNTVYEYTEKKDDWYKIITAPNHTKWINSTNVIEGELDDSEQTVSITRDSFGYSKPFFYSKKTDDILRKDTEVKTYGKIGDWYVTKVDGKNVWFNQDEIKLTTFAPNKLYKEPDLSTSTGGIAQPQTLNVKDIQITTNTDYWYKVQSWLGDVYTLGEQAGFGSIQTVSQSYNANDIKAFDTPFAETSSKTLNSEVTLVGKWQDWYKTSDNLWIKIQ